jgi:Uma2 family endonuclease
MAATTVSMQKYLRISYEGDREYIDGDVRERNIGLQMHSLSLAVLCGMLYEPTKAIGLLALTTLSLRVSETRIRVPDFCVLRREAPYERIPTYPPLLVIEVLAEEDTFHDLQERVADYFAMGVGDVWVINPYTKTAFAATARGFLSPEDGVLRTQEEGIALPLWEFFAKLER